MNRGACASGDAASARHGADVLAAGGNAVDAAVAAGLMASLTLPTMTSLAGGGVMTLRMGDDVIVLDHFASLPGHGRDVISPWEPDVVIVPFEGVRLPFLVGPLTIATPGQLAGFFRVHERYGSVPMKELAAPVIQAAREGVEVTEGHEKAFGLLEPVFRRSPGGWALIGKGDQVLEEGDRLHNEDLADTLEAIVTEGVDLFYRGEIAQRIAACSDGVITLEDLARYEPVYHTPLRSTYRDWNVFAPAMPSLTGAQVLAALAFLETRDRLPPVDDPAFWGEIATALRVSAAIRTEEYEARIFEEGYLDAVLAMCPGGSTMQCSTIDADGNVVSFTTTVGEGAGFVIPGTGIMLNNFLGEEDIFKPSEHHAPGDRMRTSMAPTILRDRKGRWGALGASGSARIRSAILQTIVQIIDSGMTLEQAVKHPRIHTEGDTIYIEAHGRTPPEAAALEQFGDEVVYTYEAGFFFGGVQAVSQTEGGFNAGADTERRGCVGYVV